MFGVASTALDGPAWLLSAIASSAREDVDEDAEGPLRLRFPGNVLEMTRPVNPTLKATPGSVKEVPAADR